MFVDTHTHLYDEAFKGEEEEAVKRALEAGVETMIFPDIDSLSRDAMFSLADKFRDSVKPCLGLHPTSINAGWRKEYELMTSCLPKKIAAIGETGLDCYWSRDYVDEQVESFCMQLELAHELDLPVIIHSREATSLLLDCLRKHRHSDSRGVLHAYSGSIETFREVSLLGDWYVGIGGVITYKKASIAETLKDIPMDRILLETDSPYLTPVPKRGTRNESSYIPYIAARIAEIKERPAEEIGETTSENARLLFGFD